MPKLQILAKNVTSKNEIQGHMTFKGRKNLTGNPNATTILKQRDKSYSNFNPDTEVVLESVNFLWMTALTNACVIRIESFSSEHPETLICNLRPNVNAPFWRLLVCYMYLLLRICMEIPRIEGKSIAKLFANVFRSVNGIASQPFLCQDLCSC